MKADEKYRIESSITIEKEPLELWNTLVEFSNYRAWNPVVNHAAIYGPVAGGTEVKILSGKWDYKFLIVEASAPHRLVIDGRSVGFNIKLNLTISPRENGSMINIDAFIGGWITRIFTKKIKRNVEESLELFLSALERRVSSGNTYQIKRHDEKAEAEDDGKSRFMPTPFNLIYKTRKKKSPGRRRRLR